MRLQLDTTHVSSAETRTTEAVGDAAQSSRAGLGRSSGAGDSISLSGASSALASFAAERSGRIQQLAAAVQNGSYHVPSSALSAAIVRNGLV